MCEQLTDPVLYKCPVFLLQYTFNFVDPLDNKSHENWCLMTNDETLVFHAPNH